MRKIQDRWITEVGEPNVVWEVDIIGINLQIERYGNWCIWNTIKIKRDGTRVYKITLDGDKRTEFFFDKPFREYHGNQFSFIEYITMVEEQRRFPNPQEYVQKGLDARIEKEYRKYLQRILRLK